MESAPGEVKTIGQRIAGAARALLRLGPFVADGLYPPLCLVCDAPVGSVGGLCPACWGQVVPITPPWCAVLGTPFTSDLGTDAVSAEALANPPPFARSRAAVIYDAVPRALVGRMKYGDRPELALFLARMMAAAGHELLRPDAVLVPVPLHYTRQVGRRYNQSAELARAIGRVANLPIDTDLLVRTRKTRQQVGLTSRQRAENVSGAFAVPPMARRRIGERPVVLVDDVFTTGATVGAAARALVRAGAPSVDVLTFARVVIGASVTV